MISSISSFESLGENWLARYLIRGWRIAESSSSSASGSPFPIRCRRSCRSCLYLILETPLAFLVHLPEESGPQTTQFHHHISLLCRGLHTNRDSKHKKVKWFNKKNLAQNCMRFLKYLRQNLKITMAFLKFPLPISKSTCYSWNYYPPSPIQQVLCFHISFIGCQSNNWHPISFPLSHNPLAVSVGHWKCFTILIKDILWSISNYSNRHWS